MDLLTGIARVAEAGADIARSLSPALAALGGAWITAWAMRQQTRLDKIKLRDADRLAALKDLYIFARELQSHVFPLATEKERSFEMIMKHSYIGSLQRQVLYFERDIATILEEMEDMYLCTTNPDLIPDTEDQVTDFVENQLFSKAQELAEFARRDARL